MTLHSHLMGHWMVSRADLLTMPLLLLLSRWFALYMCYAVVGAPMKQSTLMAKGGSLGTDITRYERYI